MTATAQGDDPATGSTIDDAGGLEALEVELILEAVRRRYGYDFTQYSRPSLVRRLWKATREQGLTTLSGLQERVLHDGVAMQRLLDTLSVHMTSMFRDPSFFTALRETVVPYLETYPFVRIWVAGCATGEEVYSLAITLEEVGLYERARIYATDINAGLVEAARDGILPIASLKDYTRNYIESGGTREFSSYYTASYDRARFSRALLKNVVFSQHSLVTDASFNEFHLILCRNVMIYFNPELQGQVHKLLSGSLRRLGILCLGKRESLRGSEIERDYSELSADERIYQRAR